MLGLALGLAWTGPGLAQERGFFSVRQHSGYVGPEKTLKQLVIRQGTQRLNHFCVIGYREPSGGEYAWVIWKEGRALILWEPSADPAYPTSLATSRRFLHLDRDVVASGEDVNGSTYLVTRDWVSQLTRDCESQGEKFAVSKEQKKSKAPRK
ncbi:hypothetical protein SAMN05443639_103430 [Stigmatella erecta]|uniref:Uncharacterized protein n=2 Tax=Stigmatella erecta TaxID=83460 RepID=A0A1I0FKQ6_9BACT|nr:hypothetical protein SAMN05443639_103430 [Stigmatella erecta]